ncbi:MAG: heme-binding protein [Verrucomicrobiota bacterium]
MTRLSKTIFTAAFIIMAIAFSARATESAPYQAIKTDGKFELREYPVLTLVEASQSPNADSNFMRLFRFIRGSNDKGQKISMTAPVFMDGSQTNSRMAFVMPATMKASDTPKPKDAGLVVKDLPAGQFAAYRFNGYRSAKNEAKALEELRKWMKAQGLPEAAPPVFAYFNPPWTLGYWRHNEVMIRTGGKKE